MTSEERIKKQKELVETVGRLYDKKGWQPVCGRILGLLIVMDKEQYTFDEIVEELQISKSSASNALRMLEISGMVEYSTIPGDRKRYFHIKKLNRFSLIDEHLVKLKDSRDFLRQVLEHKGNKNSGNALMIKDLIDILNFFLKNFEKLKNDYTANI
ncbi:MAG: MarR family transcriptional regulator [Bacteroidales bacterium]|nr:MarR family transcriptional regulator [Bacteroidales bacterium]